ATRAEGGKAVALFTSSYQDQMCACDTQSAPLASDRSAVRACKAELAINATMPRPGTSRHGRERGEPPATLPSVGCSGVR
ncbi:MAG: hypothetical protein ACPIOQ_22590, partial [Promethearchaeia archaeon]